MSNYPEGAEYDARAPYNTEEKIFKFEINIKGLYYYEYNGQLDIEEAEQAIKEALQNIIDSKDGNVDVINTDISVF